MPERLKDALRAASLPPEASALLDLYLEEILTHQRRYGLIRGSREEVLSHIVESLAACPHIPWAGSAELVDLGSGVGLPGVVLAVAARYLDPSLRITLVERRHKRALFLEGVLARLGLSNAEVFSDDVARWGGCADVAVCRAFLPLGTQLFALVEPILRPGGTLVYFAGRRSLIPAEVVKDRQPEWVRLPVLDKERWLCLVRVSPAT